MSVLNALRRTRWLLTLWLALLTAPGHAEDAAQPPAQPVPQISLVTFAPGFIYWQSYGHNALLVRAEGYEPMLFNYGMFDFEQKNFFLNFARGKMQYQLVVQRLAPVLEMYREQNRWVREQPLNLTPQQAQALFDYLLWNVRPENAEYRYDYFIANCSTRVRDALDRVLDGRVKRELEPQPADRTYREEAVRHMALVPALMLGVDAVLGPRADAPMTLWQQSFLPLTLMQAVAQIRWSDGTPLAGPVRVLLEAGEAPVLEHAPKYGLPMLLTGLLLAALLLMLRGTAFTVLALPLSLISGVGGVILLLVWCATDHWAMGANHNLLLFSPLSLLLLPASIGRAGRNAPAVAALIASAALLAPLLMLLSHAQQHAHWIALWLPLHLAMAWRLHSHRQEE